MTFFCSTISFACWLVLPTRFGKISQQVKETDNVFFLIICTLSWLFFIFFIHHQSVFDIMSRSFAYKSWKKNRHGFHFCRDYENISFCNVSLWSDFLMAYCSIPEMGWSNGLIPNYFALSITGLQQTFTEFACS